MVTSGLQETEFDLIVVGAGMGGATLGYALAKPGRRLLFLEQGRDLSAQDAIRGMPAEAVAGFRSASPGDRREILLQAGRLPDTVYDATRGDTFTPYLGCGAGGSSALYGMVLQRRYPHDFEGWPFGYEDLRPWYQQAEALYEVSGSSDPLGPDREPDSPGLAPLSAVNESVFEALRRRGLNPYRLHLASRRTAGCRMCQGYLCPSADGCKRDARTACLIPALNRGARLIANAPVQILERAGRRVKSVVATVAGEPRRFTARIVVLAAGALHTPRILLDSGLGNGSGLVGRRLMRHAIDLFVLPLARRFRQPVESKELGLNDFYVKPFALGTVQSFGMTPPLEYLRNQPGRNIWRMLGPAAGPVARLFTGAPIVATILDDSPDRENGVETSSGGLRLCYRLPPLDHKRRAKLRACVRRAFASFAPIPVRGTDDRKALGHVCGTAVFGADPRASVLDPDNRVHEADNLYVVDASFFPTSGGVNPALTVAANALRVASHLERVI
jgi:choline dehydrogenase-like flavoprotein